MCALGGPVYVNYGWPYICMLWVDLYIDAMGGLYMYAMGDPVYIYYGWSSMFDMGGPVYACYRFSKYNMKIVETGKFANHSIHIQGHA
jgi:hypothetical protein